MEGIQLWSVDEFLRWELGVDSVDHLHAGDWLTFPEQKLLEVTAGAVYHDGLGQLVPIREQLAYYPHDIWLYRLAAQWRRIAQEEAFVGRSGDVGDELGSRVVAARLVYDVMRLCFLLERRYAPYSKWLGTAFGRLRLCPAGGTSSFLPFSTLPPGRSARACLARVYETVAQMQNALAVAEPQDPSSRPYWGVRSRSSWLIASLTPSVPPSRIPTYVGSWKTLVWRERSTNGPTAPILSRMLGGHAESGW